MKHISSYVSATVSNKRMFAWMPTKTTSGKIIWFTHYYCIEKFYMILDTYRTLNTYIYTEEEYFLLKISE